MIHKIKILAVFAFLCAAFTLFIPVCFARTGADTPPPDLQAVDAFLQSQVRATRIPGLAAAIVKDGRIIFLKGYGESAPGRPVTGQTQFYIGSVSKSFTALAAMQLVDQGKLDLDAPVKQYLPWFRVADPGASGAITVRHLLNHTSGLSETGDPNASAVTSSLEEQAHLLSQVRLTAPVGTQFQYYNQNYRLVGLLIEKVSGQSYGEYLSEHIFTPVGMKNSTFDPVLAPNLTQGYSRLFGFPLAREQKFNPGAVPSGYLITTAEDLARFLIAQIDNTRADGSRLLSAEALQTMRTPPVDIAGKYAMGWMVANENGRTLGHGGALQYFQSFVIMDLDERSGFILLFNQNSMENMLFETNSVRDGLIALMNGEEPARVSYGWVGWTLLLLAAADLLNHLRLFRMLPRWIEKTSKQPRPWLGIKVGLGLAIPLAVVFGLPQLVNAIEGGAANWVEPFELMPDLTAWLLAGMALDFLRSLIHAVLLLRKKAA